MEIQAARPSNPEALPDAAAGAVKLVGADGKTGLEARVGVDGLLGVRACDCKVRYKIYKIYILAV